MTLAAAWVDIIDGRDGSGELTLGSFAEFGTGVV